MWGWWHRTPRLRLIAMVSCVSALTSSEAFAQDQNRAAAEVLFRDARKAMDRGDYEQACGKFQESNRLDPAVGTVFNLANCEEKRGNLATAWQHFDAVVQSLPPGDERLPVAKEREAALAPRLPYLTVELASGAPDKTRVVSDGIELGPHTLGTALPVNPGEHKIVVSAPGHEDRELVVTIDEAERKTVSVKPGPPLPEGEDRPARSSAEEPQADRVEAETGGPRAGRFVAFARADIDGQGRGAVFAPGAGIDVADRVELAVAGLIGADSGFEPSISIYVLTDEWQPRFTLASPIFFVDGARPGVRVSGGLAWSMWTHLGAFIDAGVVYHPSTPENYESFVFVPSIGMLGRI